MGKKKVNYSTEVKKENQLQKQEETFSLRKNLFLTIVVSAGLMLRLLYIVEIHSTPFVQTLFSDSKIYNDWAIKILSSGNWFGSEVFFMSPFYPMFLSLVYLISGQSVLIVLILQAIISAAVIYIVYYLAKILFDEQTAKISSLITALYGMFIFYSGLILSETLMTSFLLLSILYLVLAEKNNKKILWFAAGLFFGISIFIRANISILLVFVLIWFAIRIIKNKEKAKFISVSYLLLGVAIPILPVTIHNYSVSNDFVLLTSNGGINFYIGNNPSSQGVYNTPAEFDFNSDMSGKKYAENITGKQLKPSEVSSFWYYKGFGFIFGNITSAAKLYGIKFFLLLGPNENPQSSVMDYQYYKENFSQILQLPLLSFSFVSYLSIFSIYFLWKERKKYTLLFIFLIAFLVSSLLFFVNGRYRLPFIPVMIIMAAYAIGQIYSSFKNNKLDVLWKPLITVAVFILIYTFIIPKPSFTNYDALTNLGAIEYEAKNYDKAIEFYNKSLAFKDDYETYVNLGNAFAAKKDYRSSLMALQRAINRNPDYTLAYFNIGLAHSELKNYPMAIKAFAKVLELNPNFYDAYRNIAIAYYVQGDYEKALLNFQKYYPHIKDEKVRNFVSTDIQRLKEILANSK